MFAEYAQISVDDIGNVVLIILEAFPKDAGTYTLVASNVAGEVSCSCNVSVKGLLPCETSDSEIPSDAEPVRPSIKSPLSDVTVKDGAEALLECVIVGQPEPEVRHYFFFFFFLQYLHQRFYEFLLLFFFSFLGPEQFSFRLSCEKNLTIFIFHYQVIWYCNEVPVKESDNIQLLFRGDKCSLFIKESSGEDDGVYKVVAINSAGETSSTCRLRITGELLNIHSYLF